MHAATAVAKSPERLHARQPPHAADARDS
jgi:hypothetical protein